MRPSLEQQRQYLFQVFFGIRGKDELARFISRAYRDMSRTLHGVGKNFKTAAKESLSNDSKQFVRTQLLRLQDLTVPGDGDRQTAFDNWHIGACEALIQFYEERLRGEDSARMNYGQAQKWFNMAIKYCWLYGGEKLDWLKDWYEVAHFAVDEVILVAAAKEGISGERPCKKWSKWDSATEYQTFQIALREAATKRHTSPLELEFEWWAKYRPQVTGDADA